jgi:wyosine [tRNA(Phe)-imidazoG37] synthetase (radical SAM superfamily)
MRNYEHIKGVKEDKIFGKILSVNFIPYKYCNYNCIYCGVGPTTNKILKREEFYPPGKVFSEIKNFLSLKNSINYIWLTGIGEPTLYSRFKELCSTIKKEFPEVKVGLNTNGALFSKEEVREDFLDCDLVLISFSSIFQKELESICKPHKDLSLDEIKKGISSFRKKFKNDFGFISFILAGINDNRTSATALKEFIVENNPDYLFLYNFACKGFEPIKSEFQDYIYRLYEDVSFKVIFRF